MDTYVWLSYPLDPDGPRPPAIPAPSLSDLLTVSKDGARVQTLRIASHTGTHVDTPCHVVNGAVQITDFRPDELIFTRPVVLDVPLQDGEILQPDQLAPYACLLTHADLALFRFGYGAVRATDPARFSQRCPGFGLESARWLRETCPHLRAMGLDVPSVAVISHLGDTMAAHNILLEGACRRFLIIEEMDLNKDLAGLREVRVNPWMVLGMDSGPCTVVGVMD